MIGLFCYQYSVPMGLKHHLIRVVLWFLYFIFIGKFFNKEVEEINSKDINCILDCFDYLIDAYEEIEFGSTKIEKRIARLTWNDNGWVKPSGLEGKSDDKKTGFGTTHKCNCKHEYGQCRKCSSQLKKELSKY